MVEMIVRMISSDLISFLFRMKEDTAGGSQAQLATRLMNDEDLADIGTNVHAPYLLDT